jgi:hypothetical protein
VPADLVEQVLLHGGRPVLVVPSAGQYRDVSRRVLVAWNSSREAARALNDAIPLMRNAETVVVVAFQRAAGAKAVPLPHLSTACPSCTGAAAPGRSSAPWRRRCCSPISQQRCRRPVR